MSAPGIEAKVAFLRRPEAYPDRPQRVEVVETHMSWVFLTERHAYKLKKPVRYDSLDFSTPELRKHDCEEEVRPAALHLARFYAAAAPLALPAQDYRSRLERGVRSDLEETMCPRSPS